MLSAEVWRKAGPLRWRWFARGFWVNVNQVATQLSAGSDLLIVGRAISAATVVVYSSTNKLIAVLQNQPQILASVALPGLSHMKTSESRERTLLATTSLTQAMLLLAGGIACVILAVNQQFVTLWLGAHFFGGMQLTAHPAADLSPAAGGLYAGGYAVCVRARKVDLDQGFDRRRCERCDRVPVGGALGNARRGIRVPLRSGLRFRPRGRLTARPDARKSRSRELSRPYLPYLWRFAVTGCVALAVRNWFGAPNLLHLVITASIVGVVYLLLVIPYVWTTPLRGYIEGAMATLTSAMRARVLGWSNNG